MSTPLRLRFGILLNGPYVQKWQAKSVELLLSDTRIELVLLVMPEFTKSIQAQPKKWWQRIDRRFLYKGYRKYFHRIDMLNETEPTWLQEVPTLRCSVSQKGFSQFFTDNDIRNIQSYEPDFLLRFGFNIIRGSILRTARFGVWSFHHGDEQFYRGGPPGFWEILHGRKSCGAILQKLTETLDGGIILKKGHFHTTLHSLAATHNVLLENTAQWPKQVAKDILNGVLQPETLKPVSTSARIYKFPGNRTMLRFSGILVRNQLRFHLRELFCPEQWNIASVDQPLESLLQKGIGKASWLPAQKSQFFRADPFGFEDGDTSLLLFEEYDQRLRRGKINARTEAGAAVDVFPGSDFHYSYPFIFEYHGEIYCLPECLESQQLSLYKWNRNRMAFESFKTLFEKIQIADPTLCEIDGMWWLFCTHKELSNTSLHLYFAESPFGPFNPHQNNPVKWDVNGARPAGPLFSQNGKWYRPAQDCSDSYGSRIVIHEIDEISAVSFKEHPVKVLQPISPYNKGLHTISRWGKRTLIDGKIYRFSWSQFAFQLKRKLSKIGRNN